MTTENTLRECEGCERSFYSRFRGQHNRSKAHKAITEMRGYEKQGLVRLREDSCPAIVSAIALGVNVVLGVSSYGRKSKHHLIIGYWGPRWMGQLLRLNRAELLVAYFANSPANQASLSSLEEYEHRGEVNKYAHRAADAGLPLDALAFRVVLQTRVTDAHSVSRAYPREIAEVGDIMDLLPDDQASALSSLLAVTERDDRMRAFREFLGGLFRDGAHYQAARARLNSRR